MDLIPLYPPHSSPIGLSYWLIVVSSVLLQDDRSVLRNESEKNFSLIKARDLDPCVGMFPSVPPHRSPIGLLLFGLLLILSSLIGVFYYHLVSCLFFISLN